MRLNLKNFKDLASDLKKYGTILIPREESFISEMDFNKMGGVQFCETSLLTKTMVLKYNSHKIGQTEIENVFRKWECNPGEYSYQKLY